MFELAYTSRASEMMTDLQLESLLNQATRFNQLNDITGLLLYNDGIFFQLLEGEESTIKELYASIKQDFRHYDVRKIYDQPLTQRHYADWSMKFFNVSSHSPHLQHDKSLQQKLDLTDEWALPTTAKILVKAFQRL